MKEMKRWYETAKDKLWNLVTRMDTMSRDKAENSCAIQTKLDVILRNTITQEKRYQTKRKSNTEQGCTLWNLNARNKNLHHYLRSTTAYDQG